MAKTYEPGTYRARSIGGALGETSTGKEQVAVQFQLLDHEGETITWYGYFTDKTTESSFRALRTAGWKGTDLSDLSDLQGDTPEVNLVLENETDQSGTLRSRVRWVNSTGGLAMKSTLPADKAKAFAAKMKAKLIAFDQTAGTPRPQTKSAPRSSVPQSVLDAQEHEQAPSEDLPF